MLELEIYRGENLDVEAITFKDNQGCLDLIEAKKTGILAMIEEEIYVPRGSDDTLLEKLHGQHVSKSDFYKRLPGMLDRFPGLYTVHKYLPELLNAFNYGGAGSEVLAPLFKIGKLLAAEESVAVPPPRCPGPGRRVPVRRRRR